jgi:UMF1 family MFS transporter
MEFYTTASFVGLVMGGVQALARSTYSKMLPLTEDTTSFFSFYEVTEKIGIVVGMITYATILQVTGSMRLAIILVGIFFVTGFILLRRVPKAKDYNL